MTTALAALANASATFTVAAAGVVTDPTTGNVTPAVTAVTVAMFLKAERAQVAALPGVEVIETLFEGYALEAIPAGVGEGTVGTLTFAGEAVVPVEVVALRTPYGKTGLLGSTLNAALGERVSLRAREQVS